MKPLFCNDVTVYKHSLNFTRLFILIFGISSAITTITSLLCNLELTPLLISQFFCIVIAIINHLGTSNVAKLLINRGLVNPNLNQKPTDHRIPEPGALLGCVLYIIYIICVQLVHKGQCDQLLKYNAGLVSITLMTLLGFIDDILLLNWWSKIIAPILASLPLILAYNESTIVKFPRYFPAFADVEVDVGNMYYVYMIFLTVFCTNSINIYAGLNGLEIGQSLVMAFFVLVYNSIEIIKSRPLNMLTTDVVFESHWFSFYLTLPFVAINISLLCYNWYPAVIFVGNTYSLFAGIYFSVISILGNFSRIMPLIFIPQLINFVISIPQLIGMKKCPRHRLPRYNDKTNKLKYSNNYTLINLVLWLFGEMNEEYLTLTLITLQILCCTLGLIIKYTIYS